MLYQFSVDVKPIHQLHCKVVKGSPSPGTYFRIPALIRYAEDVSSPADIIKRRPPSHVSVVA